MDWHGLTLTEANTYKATEKYAGFECDSVEYTIVLTTRSCLARGEAVITDTVCAGTEYKGRLTTKTITEKTIWTDSVRVDVDGTPTDSIYKYTVLAYVQTMPAIDVALLQAICGKAVDVENATQVVNAAIASEPLYVPDAKVVWEIQENGTWVPLTDAAIRS